MRIDELKALAEDAKVGYLAGGNADELFIRLLTAVENLDATVIVLVVPTPAAPAAMQRQAWPRLPSPEMIDRARGELMGARAVH